MAARGWMSGLARRFAGRPEPQAPLSYPEALLAVRFDDAAYRRDFPMLGDLAPLEAAAHYHASGRVERFAVTFGLPLAEAQSRIDRLAIDEDDRDLLRLDVAAAELRRTDVFGRDVGRTTDLFRPSPAHRPLLVVGDSHGMLYLSEDVLRAGRLLPVPLLCTGASARGLGNPASRAGAGAKIRAVLEARRAELADGRILFKFGQVDLEFVYDYRRIREGRRDFDLAHAVGFAEESARRYVDFLRGLREVTSAKLIVTAALPPALNDAALRDGYLNAHIAELHAGLDTEALRRELQGLDMASWTVRTELARAYNTALAAACAEAGLSFYDDFTPLLGEAGVIAPDLIVWHGGTDHHLCFTSPAARCAVGAFARDLAAMV